MVTVVLDVLPRVAVVPTLLLVQQQQIERVQVADRDNIKMPIHMPVHRVKLVLLRVVVVPNFLLVQQQQIERVQIADRDNIKMQLLIQILLVKHAIMHVVLVQD